MCEIVAVSDRCNEETKVNEKLSQEKLFKTTKTVCSFTEREACSSLKIPKTGRKNTMEHYQTFIVSVEFEKC